MRVSISSNRCRTLLSPSAAARARRRLRPWSTFAAPSAIIGGGETIRGSKPSVRMALALDQQKLLRNKSIRSARTYHRKRRGEEGAAAMLACAWVHRARSAQHKEKSKKANKHKDDRLTRPWGRGECVLDHVLQGPPMFTHAFKAKAGTQKKREPPTHPHQNKQLTQLSNASKEERKDTTRRNATKTKRQTSKTEHQQDAGQRVDRIANHSSPNSRIKNQGLACEHQRKKKEKQTNKQHGPATHVSYQSTKHT